MTTAVQKTTVFLRPFQLPNFNETLPPGEYGIEMHPPAPAEGPAGARASSVRVQLPARASHPGLSRTLTVPLADFRDAVTRDGLSGKAMADLFLEEMLADPMIRLVMHADGVAEADLRDLYAPRSERDSALQDIAPSLHAPDTTRAQSAGPQSGSARPGIGE